MDLYYDPVRDDSVFVKTAWLADNDGDPTDDGRFDEQSCTGALGVAILKVADIPLDQLKYSYNWWVSHTEEDQGAANDRDWGPMWAVNERIWGWDGTPENDRMKYQVMSNGEFDYNQTDIERFSGEDPWGECPSSLIDKLRGGYDTRFLFSFGPFDIGPDDTIQVAIAVMVAEGFHNDPNNVGMPPLGTVPEGWNPDKFQYEDIAKSASWVRTIYDNDYKGPMPPPRPPFEVETYDNKIDIFWKPDTCFNYIDEITKLQDFEGFRIYVGEANMESYYTPIVEYDRVDFIDYNSTDTFHLDTIYSVMRSDLFPTDPNLTLDTVYRWDGDSVIEDIFDRRPFGTNCGMPTDSVFRYGERYYKYTLTNQRQGSDVYIAVTAYDFGQPTRELKSLESSKTYNYLWVVPKGPTGESEKAGGVYVFPNPYRIDHDYAGRTGGDWETPVGREWTEYSRKIRFANLPRKSIIRIYTVDGDLVDEIEHYDPNYLPQDLNFDGDEKDMLGAEDWDLINKNDQSIASGIYMFSVENIETGEYELGKFVIIK